jgi:hypothetical protein
MRVQFIFVFCIDFLFSFSQNTKGIRIDENTVVRDSAGTTYSPEVWKALMMHGYILKPVSPNDANTEFC